MLFDVVKALVEIDSSHTPIFFLLQYNNYFPLYVRNIFRFRYHATNIKYQDFDCLWLSYKSVIRNFSFISEKSIYENDQMYLKTKIM